MFSLFIYLFYSRKINSSSCSLWQLNGNNFFSSYTAFWLLYPSTLPNVFKITSSYKAYSELCIISVIHPPPPFQEKKNATGGH